MNDIGATGQAFINTSFAQLHDFRFICLLQSRSLTVFDNRVVTFDPITYFVTTQLFLRDESERVYTETLDLFSTKLGQYPIILGLPWFRKHLPHIQFNKNSITFDSSHCLQHCSPSYQAITISGFNTPFDYLPCLSTLSDHTMNVSSADDFAPNSHCRLLLYYHYCLRHLLHSTVNVSSINKLTNRRFCSTSSSTSRETFTSANTPFIYNPHPCYFHNSCHRLDMADSLKTMN